jgi:hypothetical protein
LNEHLTEKHSRLCSLVGKVSAPLMRFSSAVAQFGCIANIREASAQVLIISLLHNIPLGMTVATPLFKALLKLPVGIADLEQVKPELAFQVHRCGWRARARPPAMVAPAGSSCE